MSMTISDYDAADLAIDLEQKYNIDMNLKDMFSDDLNTYFDYEYNKSEDFISFYFEQEQGSCILKVKEPFSENESYEFNSILFNILRKKKYQRHNNECVYE